MFYTWFWTPVQTTLYLTRVLTRVPAQSRTHPTCWDGEKRGWDKMEPNGTVIRKTSVYGSAADRNDREFGVKMGHSGKIWEGAGKIEYHFPHEFTGCPITCQPLSDSRDAFPVYAWNPNNQMQKPCFVSPPNLTRVLQRSLAITGNERK